MPDAKEIVAAGYDHAAVRSAALEPEGSEWPRLRRLEAVLAELRDGRPGGYLLFTTEPGEEKGTVSEWLGVPMYFSQFDEGTTTLLLDESGFELVSRDAEPQLEGDREVDYVWFHARKRS